MTFLTGAAGVDEAGCGPLAGPVTAAAVILDPKRAVHGLADSKQLSPAAREILALEIRLYALAWAIGRAGVWEIDCVNIRQASLLAMRRAVGALPVPPTEVLVDGNRAPDLRYPLSTIPGGDASVAAISAASILAKVERDGEMRAWHGIYPNYGFDRHKGYCTPLHRAALEHYGPCPLHRRSFAPVENCLDAARWSSLYPESSASAGIHKP